MYISRIREAFFRFQLLPGPKFTNLRRIFSNLIQIPLSNTGLSVQRAACLAVLEAKKKKNVSWCGTRVPTDWRASKYDGIFNPRSLHTTVEKKLQYILLG